MATDMNWNCFDRFKRIGSRDWSINKVKRQMKKVRDILGDSFQADIKGPWKIVSMIYCIEIDTEYKNCQQCPKCKDFIAQGKYKLLEKLEKLHEKRKAEVANIKKFTDDFITICKFLLFCCPVMSLPVMGNLPNAVQEAVLKSGSRDNIALWCFPTPEQRGILLYPWLVFAAPFGSGKTLFMMLKAIELAEAGEKVLFLIFVNAAAVINLGKKTLLCLDLEEKFKNYDKIKVKMVPFIDGRKDNLKGMYSLKRKIFRNSILSLKPQKMWMFF